MNSTQTKAPVLLMIWKRADLSEAVFRKVKEYRPSKLYISCDGTKFREPKLSKKIHETRQKILSFIDWDCVVRFKFENINLGCKTAISSSIDWFFRNEEMGIILEDDCVPSSSFMNFAETMLYHYIDNPNVCCITGVNFQDGTKHGKDSYYFSKYNHCWGWASWRRAWAFFDKSINFWPTYKYSEEWKQVNSHEIDEINYWTSIFDLVYNNEIDSWAYPWLLSCWKSNMLTVTPNKNLVTNIGFRKDSTHTKNSRSKFANMEAHDLSDGLRISNPKAPIVQNKGADRYTFQNHYASSSRLNKIKKKIKSFMP